MRTETIEINLNQKLGDIMSFIPTNAIFNKKIPGLGATYLELICKRCSIVIVPNKPVIKGKVKQFREEFNIDILGVYHGIKDDRVIEYITSTNPIKKIMTTPESYILRIKPLMIQHGIDVLNDYFMLYDESERIIQDNNYRDTITAPIDDFFNFKEKAMVTATPINPSDPRFESNGFYHLLIKPTFDYSKVLELITTNNVLISVREYLKGKDGGVFCFFLNSTDGISSIIKYLDIANESQIFCGDKSVKKLRKEGFKNAYSDLKPLVKYNFFTSSFFSAVDIELSYKPHVVILTDLFFAEHSMIDPATEAVQIVGRFRKGFKSLTHITNINYRIKFQTSDELKKYLTSNQDAYSSIKTLHDCAEDLTLKEAFDEALKSMTFADYVRADGNINWFRIDNKLDEEMVKSVYSSVEHLKDAYSRVEHFKITHSAEKYPLTDEHRLKRTYPKDDVELFKSVVQQLDILNQKRSDYTIDNSLEFYNQLNDEHSDICELYKKLGQKNLEKLGYSLSKAKRQLRKDLEEKNKYPFPAIREILRSFNHRLSTYIPVSDMERVGNTIRVKYNISQKPLQFLKNIYDVSPRKQFTIKNQRVWCRQLSNPKFNIPD
jgi:hypothetical protein